jgi:hypothetical protein
LNYFSNSIWIIFTAIKQIGDDTTINSYKKDINNYEGQIKDIQNIIKNTKNKIQKGIIEIFKKINQKTCGSEIPQEICYAIWESVDIMNRNSISLCCRIEQIRSYITDCFLDNNNKEYKISTINLGILIGLDTQTIYEPNIGTFLCVILSGNIKEYEKILNLCKKVKYV